MPLLPVHGRSARVCRPNRRFCSRWIEGCGTWKRVDLWLATNLALPWGGSTWTLPVASRRPGPSPNQFALLLSTTHGVIWGEGTEHYLPENGEAGRVKHLLIIPNNILQKVSSDLLGCNRPLDMGHVAWRLCHAFGDLLTRSFSVKSMLFSSSVAALKHANTAKVKMFDSVGVL